MKTKIASIILILSLCLSSLPVCAAEESSDSRKSVRGSELTTEVIEAFNECGINLNSNSIVSESRTENGTASYIVVSPDGEGNYERSLLTCYSENGEPYDVNIEELTSQPTRGSTSLSFTTYAAFTVTVTGTYTLVYDGNYELYRPYSCSTYYRINSGYSGTVSSLKGRYICSGAYEYYPSRVLINSSYSYTITASKSNPQQNTIYSNTSPMGSGYVIDIFTGLVQGNKLWFQIVYNGNTYEDQA